MFEPPEQPTFARPVRGGDVAAGLGAFLAAGVALVGLGLLLRQAGAGAWLVPAGGVLQVLLVWPALRLRGFTIADLGLVAPRRPLRLLWQVPLAWAATMLVTAPLADALLGPRPPGPSAADAEAVRSAVGDPAALASLVLLMALGIPALEEIVFRRLLYAWLERRWGVGVAVVASAAVFGAVHVLPEAVLVIGGLGVAAAVLARRQRSLWAPVALHMFNNTIVVAAILSLG
ncbi:CPBP family intramembrane glutamic endopeptidase [Corynebacterium sphenisci]|uniref:CPBP family intramembrane glutamic endopeptidase n=1 Tax=Corynebacterium sphenisci TaxID=191493 RepID=UPI0026DFA762|nr:type II CAAX endopeptidase family protein [Corynebacterium sphenisci]MDO5731072.1 type II CAAX endopeptidase family protein [Corynebacterium sphenisci]